MTISQIQIRALFDRFAARMDAECDQLCALDGAIGDGDHGLAMKQGMSAAAQAVNQTEGTFQALFQAGASAFLNAVGASSGPLYATGMLRAGKALGAVTQSDAAALLQIIPAMAEGIAHRGKAAVGQKTMIDAWAPAAAAVQAGKTGAAVLAAAAEGAEATRQMQASLGRASRLGERVLGHPDPGAVSAVMLIEEILRAAEKAA